MPKVFLHFWGISDIVVFWLLLKSTAERLEEWEMHYGDSHVSFSPWAPYFRSSEGQISVVKFNLFSSTPCQMSPMIPSILDTFLKSMFQNWMLMQHFFVAQIPLSSQGHPCQRPQREAHSQSVPWMQFSLFHSGINLTCPQIREGPGLKTLAGKVYFFSQILFF